MVATMTELIKNDKGFNYDRHDSYGGYKIGVISEALKLRCLESGGSQKYFDFLIRCRFLLIAHRN
jgi:hypothetical protein